MKCILMCAPLMALGLLACSDSGINSSGSMTAVGADSITITYTRNIPIKQTSTYFVQGSFDCLNDGVLEETWGDTTYYKASSGTLLVWSLGNCFADLGRGSGSNLNGTWILRGEYGDAVNADSTTCEPLDTAGNGPSNPFTAVFTNTNISVSRSMPNYCWSSDFVSEGDASYQAVGCNQYTVTTSAGVATYTLDKVNVNTGEMVMSFSFNGSTCSMHAYPEKALNASTCVQAWASYQADSSANSTFYYDEYMADSRTTESEAAYATCLANTGFESSAMEKKASTSNQSQILQTWKKVLKQRKSGF